MEGSRVGLKSTLFEIKFLISSKHSVCAIVEENVSCFMEKCRTTSVSNATLFVISWVWHKWIWLIIIFYMFFLSLVCVGVGKFKGFIGSTSYITLCLLKNFIYCFLKGNILLSKWNFGFCFCVNLRLIMSKKTKGNFSK